MLYLHGGPGFPEIAFMKKYSQFLEKNFIMVYWEQKGAGKSYFKDTSNKNLNLESLISDKPHTPVVESPLLSVEFFNFPLT
jgi:hypothetical protein